MLLPWAQGLTSLSSNTAQILDVTKQNIDSHRPGLGRAVQIAEWSKVFLPYVRRRNLLSSYTSQTGDVTKQNKYSHRSELRRVVPIAEWSQE